MNKLDFCDEMESYLTSVQNNIRRLERTIGYEFNEIKAILKDASEIHLSRLMENMYLSTYNCDTFFINLMVFISALKYQRDNLDNLEAIVDDISGLDIEIDDVCEIPFAYIELGMFDEIINFIVRNENYKDDYSLRKYLITFLKDLKTPGFCKDLYKQSISEVESLPSSRLREIGGKEKASYVILGKKFDKCVCDKILYFGDRYFYVNKKLIEIEKNHLFRRQILSSISNLDKDLFDYLNKDSDSDVFIRCMDIVFDSDSYIELCNKLNYLKDVSLLFKAGNNIDGEIVLNDLLSSVHKEIYLGQEVSYPNNKTMNLTIKPKTIIERMEELYSKIEGSSWTMEDNHYMSSSIGAFILKIANLKEYKAKVKRR